MTAFTHLGVNTLVIFLNDHNLWGSMALNSLLHHTAMLTISYYSKRKWFETTQSLRLLEQSMPARLHKSPTYLKNAEREKGRNFGMQICASKTRDQQARLQCMAG